MRNLRVLFTVAFSILLLQACGGGKVDYSGHPVLTGLDPVSLLDGNRAAGNEAHSVTHGGFLYYFSNAANKARFEADPGSYQIQSGDSCLVSPGAQPDPDIFVVHEGKIYVFASAGCVETFQEDPESYIG